MIGLGRRIQPFLAILAVLTILGFASEASARAGGGFSLGSRGMRTFTPPAATPTAPNSASPIQRSMTQPGQNSRGALPGGGFFNRPGLLGGLFGGFLGAGLLGLLFGYGLFGGLGGLASVLGLVLQVILVVVAARLIWSWWQRRQAPAYAGASMLRKVMPDAPGASSGGLGGVAATSGAVQIEPKDYDTFERLLGEVQRAYSAEDLNALRPHVTPEMLSYFAEELAKNASRGVVNRIGNVKLLKGDVAEAWREGQVVYATVAMRFSLIDETIDRATGRVVEGDPNRPVEITELWTFMRTAVGSWLLSAIQQA
jgi:predicted lipid-binding transport protein (Tim44 family)